MFIAAKTRPLCSADCRSIRKTSALPIALTIWEYGLRRGTDEPGYFVLDWIERLIYPDVSPLVYLLPTYAIALFTLVMFVVKPPAKFRRLGER